MSAKTLIKPTLKAIKDYYVTLQSLSEQNVSHEMGLRRAFQTLLADTARLHDWTLVTEDAFTPNVAQPPSAVVAQPPSAVVAQPPSAVVAQPPSAVSRSVRPDGTLRDKNTLPRGFWEAKDTADSLAKEIDKKSKRGYSLVNTIFEDTEKAVL